MIPATFRRSIAAQAVAVAIVAAACWTTWEAAATVPLFRNSTTNALVARFNTLRDRVPAVPVGYASALQPSDAAFWPRQMTAQYVLVPTAVDVKDTHQLAVADFDTDAALRAYVSRVQGTIRVHGAEGLALVERPVDMR